MSKGIDYAWANPKPSPSCLHSQGITFIMRYFSHDPSKDLTSDELVNAVTAGIAVGVVWETTANRMLAGYNAGVEDARYARDRANDLGIGTIPIYFACDWDASESEQAVINAYLDGCTSVIGKARVGMYAGYWPLKRAFDAGKLTWGWQTYAWSGGNWDSRAQLRQTLNNVTVCGTSSDWDESKTADFGQWPRPAGSSDKPDTGKDNSVFSVDYDPNGNAHYACLDIHGVLYYWPPGWTDWGRIDPHQSGAKSGAGIAISHDWWVTLTLVNSYGRPVKYVKKWMEGEWVWSEQGKLDAA